MSFQLKIDMRRYNEKLKQFSLSVQLLALFTSLKEEVFNALPIEKWDSELLEKMKETFYGTVYDIESITGWERNQIKREFKVKGGKKRELST